MITPTDSSNLQFHDSESDQARLASMNMPAPGTPQNPMAMLDDLLRGRWKIAIALGIVLAGICAVAGYRFAPVRYSSTGRIHIAPRGSAILHETQETGNLLGYSGVVGTQAQLVMSARVIDLALKDPTLSALPFIANPNAREHISARLTASAERGTELITVSYEAATPEEAQLILNAVLRWYYNLYGHSAGEQLDARLDILDDRRIEKQRDLNIFQKETREFIATSEYGASDYTQILENRLVRQDELRQTLSDIELKLALLRINDDRTKGSREIDIPEPLVEELEIIDPQLATLGRQYLDQEVKLKQIMEKYHGNMKHHAVISEVEILDTLDELIANRYKAARESWFAAGGSLPPNATSPSRMSPKQLVDQQAQISEMLVKVKAEMRQLNDVQGQLKELQQKENDTKADLEIVATKIEILKLESNPEMFSGRIEIYEGSISFSPSKDKRKQLAIAGCVGGFGFSLGLFVLLGIIDKRAYSSSQLRHDDSKYRCLGVLPDLSVGRYDPARAEVAVHCVHQIRNRIEAHRSPTTNFVLLVTSPQQGDGKTSLAMALASSYAFAGYRTLVIDCDLVGMGVTRQLSLTQHQGLREVLGSKIDACQATRVISSNLDILGSGLDTQFGPESVRRDEFDSMCNELRHTYDVIIIDSGPFIGSVELLPIAVCADCVVLTVRRGRSRHKLQECIADLEKMSVRTLGVVLNRAVRSDCDHYVSYSVISEKHLFTANGESHDSKSSKQSGASENLLLRAMNMSHEDDHGSTEEK